MNSPLELVAKTLFYFNEKELTIQLLDAFGKRAQLFSEYEEIAKTFFEIKNFPKAIEYGEKALKNAKSLEEKYTTSKNLINAYNQFNYPEKALTQIEKCKKINSNDVELLFEETTVYSQLGLTSKAHKLLLKLLERTDLTEEVQKKAYHNLSGYYFRQDDIHTALKHFLKEGEKEAYKNKKIPYEKWNGEIIQGKTILIDSECGAGDEIIHVRFMKNLEQLGMNPIWTTTREDLSRIFNENGFKSICVKDISKLSKDTCWVYALAIPYYLNLTVHDLGKTPYLKSTKDEKYNYIQEDKKYKIGMFWNSDSGFEQAHFRSVDFLSLFNVLNQEKHSLYSLQMSDNPVPEECKNRIQEFHFKNRTFEDTFSIIQQMNLVVTSCTSIAHIAASMGKEVCVFVPLMEYYVWTSSDNQKSWWYGDNVHLFKQKKPRDWSSPLQELENFLK